MSPRRYRMGLRQAASDRTRARILAAARDLLTPPRGFQQFTLEAVAREADVARMTVYYQFRSKAQLLESLYDHIVARRQMARLREVSGKPDALAALLVFIGTWVRVWNSDRVVFRQLHAAAALDPEIAQRLQAREARRKQDLQVILARVREQYGHPSHGKLPQAVEIVHMHTSFEAFDRLAGTSRRPREVADTVRRLALAAIVLYGGDLG